MWICTPAASDAGHEAITTLLIDPEAYINIMAMTDAPRVSGTQHITE